MFAERRLLALKKPLCRPVGVGGADHKVVELLIRAVYTFKNTLPLLKGSWKRPQPTLKNRVFLNV